MDDCGTAAGRVFVGRDKAGPAIGLPTAPGLGMFFWRQSCSAFNSAELVMAFIDAASGVVCGGYFAVSASISALHGMFCAGKEEGGAGIWANAAKGAKRAIVTPRIPNRTKCIQREGDYLLSYKYSMRAFRTWRDGDRKKGKNPMRSSAALRVAVLMSYSARSLLSCRSWFGRARSVECG